MTREVMTVHRWEDHNEVALYWMASEHMGLADEVYGHPSRPMFNGSILSVLTEDDSSPTAWDAEWESLFAVWGDNSEDDGAYADELFGLTGQGAWQVTLQPLAPRSPWTTNTVWTNKGVEITLALNDAVMLDGMAARMREILASPRVRSAITRVLREPHGDRHRAPPARYIRIA